jgi:hypothetical protein
VGEGVIFYTDGSPTRDITVLSDSEVARVLDTEKKIEVFAAIPSAERVMYLTNWLSKKALRKSVDGFISIQTVGTSVYSTVASNSLRKIQNLIRESPNHLDLFGDFFGESSRGLMRDM